jgi:uncharacterized membrane protein (UPF0127 family)
MKNTLSVQFGRAMTLITVIYTLVSGCDAAESQSDSTVIIATRNARHTFTVELARTAEEMQRGLMFRTSLAADHGMLFLYADDQPVSFWMKNTFIPLDLLFIDRQGTILRIAQRAVPQSTALIPSGEPVRAVLEVNGGTAGRLGIAVGDRVLHPAFSE